MEISKSINYYHSITYYKNYVWAPKLYLLTQLVFCKILPWTMYDPRRAVDSKSQGNLHKVTKCRETHTVEPPIKDSLSIKDTIQKNSILRTRFLAPSYVYF